MYDPQLYRDAEGIYHSTRRCPAIAGRCPVEPYSWNMMNVRRYEQCGYCIPGPLFVPKLGSTERRVYHMDLLCRRVPRAMRYPVLQYDWIHWPDWQYDQVIHDFGTYLRCTHCIPDRSMLYPLENELRGRRAA